MKVVSLFSGAGGMDLGFQMAGHDIIFALDNNKYACSTYQKNLKFTPVWGDIKAIASYPEADMVIACCPCQGFSIYGTRKYSDDRNLLYKEIIRCLKLIKPRFVIIENVKGLLSLYKRRFFNMIINDLESVGYKVSWKIMNAKNYGVPQDRKRVFIVGIRKDISILYNFPKETHGPNIYTYITLKQHSDQSIEYIIDDEIKGSIIKPYVTLKQAIGHLKPPNEGEYWGSNNYSFFYMSRNRRRKWNQVSYTIQANGRHVPLHPSCPPMEYVEKDRWIFSGDASEYRRLSAKECALIQTFPDDFEFEGPLSQQYTQIGNAVPPTVAYHLALEFSKCEARLQLIDTTINQELIQQNIT